VSGAKVKNPADDELAIRDLVDTWMTATRSGDQAKLLSLIADDAIFMVPGQEPFGKEAFAAAAATQSGLRIEGSGDIREIQVLGDWAYLRNHISLSVTTPDGRTSRRNGYTLTILRKQETGKWALVRDANLLTGDGE
jgi:uncharacterized protein (TIGR02246 family)